MEEYKYEKIEDRILEKILVPFINKDGEEGKYEISRISSKDEFQKELRLRLSIHEKKLNTDIEERNQLCERCADAQNALIFLEHENKFRITRQVLTESVIGDLKAIKGYDKLILKTQKLIDEIHKKLLSLDSVKMLD